MFKTALKIVACTLIMGVSAPLYADNTDLSEVEIADLAFMREEEKMARDVYAELYQYCKGLGVYTSLLCGSREHLRAFVKRLGADGYQPELL
jgi:hypothetical protein